MTSSGQIIRSLDGIKCISEMPPHMYLSTIVEPSLQTILLSKWSTFPRFLSFIISAIIGFLFISYSTEIPILFASPEYGSQYAFIFFYRLRSSFIHILIIQFTILLYMGK